MAILGFIKTLFGPATDLIDDLHLSKEEKLVLGNELERIKNGVTIEVIKLERDLTLAQTEVLKADTVSSGWLTRSWRPITILTFVGLLVWTWLTTEAITPELQHELLEIIKWTLGVYMGGRSMEKIVAQRTMSQIAKRIGS